MTQKNMPSKHVDYLRFTAVLFARTLFAMKAFAPRTSENL